MLFKKNAENDGSENFTEILIDGSLNGALGLAINDIDGDGDLDIFATAFNGGSVVWYENNGSQSFTKSTIATLGAAYDVRVNDLEGNGEFFHEDKGEPDLSWIAYVVAEK